MDNKITIGFHLINEYGDEYSASSKLEVMTECGDTNLTVIGEQLNCFLSQCGYVRKRPCIFMEDITDDEYDAIASFLEEYRAEQDGSGE